MTEEFDLKRSKEIVGHLYPVLLDAHGNVIDGLHRLEVDPNWPKQKLGWVKTDKDRELVRAHANLMRRHVELEERKRQFESLARLMAEAGVKKKEIAAEMARIVPFSDRYVRMLLPDEFKAKEMRRESAEILPQVECDLQKVVGELIAALEQRNLEGKCSDCRIAAKCTDIRQFIGGVLE